VSREEWCRCVGPRGHGDALEAMGTEAREVRGVRRDLSRQEHAMSEKLLAGLIRLRHRGGRTSRSGRGESGMTTAELLGNAALGVFALIVIWAGLREVGLDVVRWIRSDLLGAR